jgi:hypothetical protein
MISNKNVQRRVFLPFTNERDHLGRLQLVTRSDEASWQLVLLER